MKNTVRVKRTGFSVLSTIEKSAKPKAKQSYPHYYNPSEVFDFRGILYIQRDLLQTVS